MALPSRKLSSAQWQGRRLNELLEEKQEPFLLHQRSLPSVQASLFCWPGCGILSKPSSPELKSRRREGRGILSSTLVRLSQLKLVRTVLHWNSKNELLSTRTASFGSLHCSSGLSEKASTNGGKQSEKKEVEEQRSPVSVLDLRTDEGSESPSQSAEARVECHERKKLQFDCAEDVEGGVWVSNQRVICKLIGSELSKSMREWSQLQTEIREVGLGIEDDIFEEIKEEIVRDLIRSSPWTLESY